MTPRARTIGIAFALSVAGVVLFTSDVARDSRTAPAGDLPDRFADTTFWRLFESMSEEGGYFRSDNFVSNEAALQYVIPHVRERVGQGGVYVGVGPEQNFTYLVAFKPRVAFIVDIRRQNALAHLMYKALFELSADRAEFLSRLFGRTRPPTVDTLTAVAALMDAFLEAPRDTALFYRNITAVRDHLRVTRGFALSAEDFASIEYVMRAFEMSGPGLTYSSGRGGAGGGTVRGGQRAFIGFGGGMPGMPTFAWLMTEDDGEGVERSFLATEENYRTVREMQLRNAVIPVVGDFAGDKALRSLGAFVKSHGATVGVFYTSNVEQYLFQNGDAWSRFYENVGRLPLSERSTFIRSATSRFAPRSQHPNARMTQLTMPMLELVKAFRGEAIRSYYDVIDMSR